MNREWYISVFTFLLLTFMVVACEIDDDDSGDGKLSYMRADFANIHTADAKTVDYALTDNNDSLRLTPLATCGWAAEPDSLYRALLYYNVKTKDTGNVEAISISQVLALTLMTTSKLKEIYTDPILFESAWVSPNHKYLNLGLYVKTGYKEGDEKQTLGMLCDSIYTHDDGTRRYDIRLFHNQNNIPAYYSSRVYASVPLDDFQPGDTLFLSVNTYEGLVQRTIVY